MIAAQADHFGVRVPVEDFYHAAAPGIPRKIELIAVSVAERCNNRAEAGCLHVAVHANNAGDAAQLAHYARDQSLRPHNSGHFHGG